MLEVILKHFEEPDETRRFEKGMFEIVQLADRRRAIRVNTFSGRRALFEVTEGFHQAVIYSY